MVTALQPTRALIDPADAVPASVKARRWILPLLLLMLCTSFSGAAFAVRWEAGPAVVRELSESGELSKITEKELADRITTASRVKLVGGVARGIFVMPLIALLLAVAVKIACWLIARPIPFAHAFSAVTLALLPIALYRFLFGAVALSSQSLTEAQIPKLVPSHLGVWLTGLTPEMSRLASTVDFFNLWSAVLLGIGISAATGMRRWSGIVFALVLYVAFAGVFLVGLPAMGGGGR